MKLWTDKTWREYKGEFRWAKLRVKHDETTGEDYFDVLLGKVGEEWHSHLGIALDQSLLFRKDRGLIRHIQRKMESRQKGFIEGRDLMVNPEVSPGEELILKLGVNPNTGKVTVLDFGIAE